MRLTGQRRMAALAVGVILLFILALFFVFNGLGVQTVGGTIQGVDHQSITLAPSRLRSTPTIIALTPFTTYENVTGRGTLNDLRLGQQVEVRRLDVLGTTQVALDVKLDSLPGSPSHW